MGNEIVDVVDENDAVIGHATREEVHAMGKRHRGIHILVFDKTGRLLVEKRSERKDLFPGMYNCSVSEHLKRGESYMQAAKRGLNEELGISAEPKELCKLSIDLPASNDMMNDIFYELVFHGEIDPKKYRESDKEFFSIGKLKRMIKGNGNRFTPWFIICFSKYLEIKGLK
jgi:isopentenyl-diphosphate delta-isomerase type 1